MSGPCFICRDLGPRGPGEVVSLEGQEAHHLAQVLRHRTGDVVELRDGEGGWATARVVGIHRRRVELRLVEVGAARDDRLPLVVLLSMLKREAMERAIVRLCEWGVHRIVPVVSARSVARPGPSPSAGRRLERWRGLALAALKQSRGLYLTEIAPPSPLSRPLADGCPQGWARFLLDEAGGEGADALPHWWGGEGAVLAVGPEGGWAPEEREQLMVAGFEPISLGPRVLRSEVAALAGAVWLGILLRRGR